MREAAKESDVFITSSGTVSFGGAKTMIPTPTLGHGVEGDAALELDTPNAMTTRIHRSILFLVSTD